MSDLTSRVFLTGMMGSGKSSAGALMADALGLTFVDLDREVERAAGKTIAELFDEGEDHFRELEALALRAAIELPHVLIATGGGTLLTDSAIAAARTAGTIVYLRTPAESLAQRLVGADSRPLLRGADGRSLAPGALRRRVAELLREREGAYMQADIVVDIGDLPAEEVARRVVDELRGYRERRNERR